MLFDGNSAILRHLSGGVFLNLFGFTCLEILLILLMTSIDIIVYLFIFCGNDLHFISWHGNFHMQRLVSIEAILFLDLSPGEAFHSVLLGFV